MWYYLCDPVALCLYHRIMLSNCGAGPWSVYKQENLFYNLKECEGLPLDVQAFLEKLLDTFARSKVVLPEVTEICLSMSGYQCDQKKRKPTRTFSISTSSSRRLCSFCCSIRFCLSASSCLLYSSCSRSCCSCRSCCLRRASVRSLFSCCSLRKSRRRVDSPGTLTMEL